MGREEFLAQFKARHCYLVDLFRMRGRNIQKANKEERQNAVRQLTRFLQVERPRIITPVLKRIQKSVFEAFQGSRIQARFKPLVYPTRQYIPQYQSGLQAILSEF